MSTVASRGPTSRPLLLSAILVGMVPAIMVLLPWDFGSDMNAYRGFLRGTSFTVSIVQMLVVGIGIQQGFKLIPSIFLLPKSTQIGLALFWIVFLYSSLFIAARPLYALLGVTQLTLHLLFILAITHLISAQRDFVLRHIWIAVGMGVVAYALLWFVNIEIYHPQGNDWLWFVPALTHIRWIGFFALASWCAGLGVLATTVQGRLDYKKVILPMLFLVVGLCLAIWTATRGAILAISIATILTAYFSKDWKSVSVVAFAALIIAIIAALNLPIVHPAYGLERLLGSATQFRDVNDLSSNRINLWYETIQKSASHPWVGWGIDQFRFSGPDATLGFRHPHQSILQLIFATGVVGSIAFGLVVLPLLKHLPVQLKTPAHWAAGSYIIAGVIYGLHDGFFYYTYPVMIFLVAVAMILKPDERQSASGM